MKFTRPANALPNCNCVFLKTFKKLFVNTAVPAFVTSISKSHQNHHVNHLTLEQRQRWLLSCLLSGSVKGLKKKTVVANKVKKTAKAKKPSATEKPRGRPKKTATATATARTVAPRTTKTAAAAEKIAPAAVQSRIVLIDRQNH